MNRAVIALVAIGCVRAAFADQPLLRPTQDLEVVYRTNATPPMEQRVRWRVATQTMRIDSPTPGLYVIIDYLARHMSVVRDPERAVIDMAAPESMVAAVAGKETGGFIRHGEAVVAGLPCTEWETLDRRSHPALMCISADGVLLRVGTEKQVLVSAVSVHYGPQDPAAFRVPADYEHHAARAAR